MQSPKADRGITNFKTRSTRFRQPCHIGAFIGFPYRHSRTCFEHPLAPSLVLSRAFEHILDHHIPQGSSATTRGNPLTFFGPDTGQPLSSGLLPGNRSSSFFPDCQMPEPRQNREGHVLPAKWAVVSRGFSASGNPRRLLDRIEFVAILCSFNIRCCS